MDELRSTIWDYLYGADQAASLESVARYTACDQPTIQAAVDHEWFKVTVDGVQIAYREKH